MPKKLTLQLEEAQAEIEELKEKVVVAEYLMSTLAYANKDLVQRVDELESTETDTDDKLRERIEKLEDNLSVALCRVKERNASARRERDRASMWEHEAQEAQRQVKRLQTQLSPELQENHRRNRDFCDQTTNYFGPFAKKMLSLYERMDEFREEFQQMHDAYYTTGVDWPWEENDPFTGQPRETT